MGKQYDVIVLGGGISGAAAAIAAARLGVRVLLVERYGFLGGMLTAGGVGPMMTFHAGNKLAVRGVTNELIERMAAKGKSPGHIFDSTGYTYTVTPFDNEAMKHELELMLLEAGGELLYHSALSAANVENGVLQSIEVCTKNADRIVLEAASFVDATGDANLARLSGVACVKGRPADGASQPMTMNLKISGVDIERVREYIRDEKNIDEFPRIKDDLRIVDKAPRLSIGGFEVSFERARRTGELSFERGEVLFFETNNPGEVIINTSRVILPDPTDPWQFTQAEIEGRKQARELEQFLIRRIPGFEKSVLVHSGPVQIGVRSSRQIVGLHVLTEDELADCISFDDVIAHGGYHIDVHPPAGNYDKAFLKKFKERSHLGWGAMYSVPLGSLLNEAVPNIVTVGRCISCTFMAQGAIRVSPIAGATGHAGGVAAALAAKAGVLPTAVPYRQVQEALIGQGAYLER